MNKPYIIAEMGVNFYDTAKVLGITPLEAAKLYIDKAAEAGIDCQSFNPIRQVRLFQKIHLRIGIHLRKLLRHNMNYF